MAKVWTYVIPRELNEAELQQLQKAGNEFVKGWTAHDKKLSGDFEVVGKRIVKVTVDESTYAASGCSIDKLQRFMKEAGKQFKADFMDRMQVAYEKGDKIDVVQAGKISRLLEDGEISADTLVYDTSISNSEELATWKKPLSQTWLKKYLS